MAKKSSMTFVEDFAFYEQLWNYYISNRGKIRSRYNDLTKKFLAYNDRNENPDAFLRTPQFEALEMYVFIKEFRKMLICFRCLMIGEIIEINFQMSHIIQFTNVGR